MSTVDTVSEAAKNDSVHPTFTAVIGDEDIYRTLNLPLQNDTTDGCYLDDHEHLSPTVDHLISWNYRQSIRQWYNNLNPPPITLAELAQL